MTTSGKIVKTSILTGGSSRPVLAARTSQVEQTFGDVDVDRAGRGVVAGDEAQRDQAAGLEHQQVAGRVGLDRGDPAQRRPVRRRAPSAPTSSCDPERSGYLERLGLELGPAQRSAAVRSVTPSNWTR